MPVDARLDDFDAGLRPLWLRAQSGDKAAYRDPPTLIAARLRACFRPCVQGWPDDLAEWVPETLLALHLQRGTFDPTLPVSARVQAVARHKRVDRWRRRGRHEALREPLDDVGEHAPDSLDNEEGGTRRDLAKLQQTLPEAQRLAITLTKRDGPSLVEAAQRTGASASVTRVQVHCGPKRLAALVTVTP